MEIIAQHHLGTEAVVNDTAALTLPASMTCAEQHLPRRRWMMELAYRGAPFHGWQVQPNAVTVQSVVEDALATALRVPTPVTGAGRTDTGVNARRMFAHFDTRGDLPDKGRLLASLNRLVGRDISIRDIRPVHDTAHARFDATSRTYRYFVLHEKSPFLYPLSWHCPNPLDMDAMNRAAALLPDTEDFTSFAKLHSDTRTNICHLTHARWERLDGADGMVFTVTADRFLRNMVRALVGTLVEVGRGRLTPEGFGEVIRAHDRCRAGQSMPAEALFLWDVTYPY